MVTFSMLLVAALAKEAPSLQGLVAEADVVFEGTVVDEFSVVTDKEHDFVVTLHVVDVVKEFKGHIESRRIYVGVPGGRHPDGSESVIAGAPWFDVGETVVVLGRVVGQDSVRIIDWRAGSFVLSGDEVLTGRRDVVVGLVPGERVSLADLDSPDDDVPVPFPSDEQVDYEEGEVLDIFEPRISRNPVTPTELRLALRAAAEVSRDGVRLMGLGGVR